MTIPMPEHRPDWLFGRNPDGIEAQEAAGQRAVCNSSRLPVEGSEHPAWAEIGITFGEPDSDGLFRPASLPDGWRIAPTDHNMWSDLLDNRGRRRAEIFYKAAFYDRRAFVRLNTRYSVTYGDGDDREIVVRDCDRVIFSASYDPVPRSMVNPVFPYPVHRDIVHPSRTRSPS